MFPLQKTGVVHAFKHTHPPPPPSRLVFARLPKPDPVHRQLQPETWSEGGRAAGLHLKPGEAQWKRDMKKLLLSKRRSHMIYWLTSTENKSKTTTAKSKPSKHLGGLITLCLLLPLQSPNEWNFVSLEKRLIHMGAVSGELFQVMKFPNTKYCIFPSFQLENCRNADLRVSTWYWYFW